MEIALYRILELYLLNNMQTKQLIVYHRTPSLWVLIEFPLFNLIENTSVFCKQQKNVNWKFRDIFHREAEEENVILRPPLKAFDNKR